MGYEQSRRELGSATLERITGSTGTAVVEGLKDVAPVYSGFPSAINALNTAREVFKERGFAAIETAPLAK